MDKERQLEALRVVVGKTPLKKAREDEFVVAFS